LQKYGKILLNHLPEPTTKLLIDLCTGELYLAAQNPRTPEPVGPTEVSHPGGIPYPSFLQFHAPPTPSLNAETQANVTAVDTPKEPKTVAYKPPPVRTFMSLFVDQPNYLIQFLEKVSQKRWGGFGSIKPSQPAHNLSLAKGQYVPVDNDADEAAESLKSIFESDAEIEEKKAVWNTLLELYLSEAYLPPVISTKDAKGRKYGAPGTFGVTTETERVKEKLIRKDKALQLLMDEDVRI
jgi:hypothetical protein